VAIGSASGIATAITALLLLTLGCTPIPIEEDQRRRTSGAPGNPRGTPIVLAEVGDLQITDRQLQERILSRYYGPRALLGLVREALFLEEAKRLELTITEPEIAALVEKELKAVLGVTPEERRASLDRLRWQGLSVEDVRAELSNELQGLLLIQKVVSAHRTISEAALLDRYAQSWSTPRRKVRHIAFPVAGDPEDDEVRGRVKIRAESVRNAILSGAPFAESARSLSGNPETAARGGEIGWLSRDEFGNDRLAEFVFGLEVGALSSVYPEGAHGFHIFQVLEERPQKPFEEVAEELRQELIKASPTDDEILEIESELRRRIRVRVRADISPPISP